MLENKSQSIFSKTIKRLAAYFYVQPNQHFKSGLFCIFVYDTITIGNAFYVELNRNRNVSNICKIRSWGRNLKLTK